MTYTILKPKLISIVTAIAILGCAATPSENPAKQDFAVIAYYSGDASEIDKYPVEKLTHIIFSFLHLQGNQLAVDNSNDDLTIRRLVSLKQKHPQLKIILSLGGWGGCETCSDVFSTAQGRREFAESVKELLVNYNADGLDLDWEYPAIEGYPGHVYRPEDKHNFTLLIEQLRQTFGNRYELSFAAGGFLDFLKNSVEWEKVMPLLDKVNVMTYDLVNGYSKVTGHHTSLGKSSNQKESVLTAVHFLDSLDVPRNKVVIGAAFYARVWQGVAADNNGLYQSGVFKEAINFKDFESYFLESDGFKEFYDLECDAYYFYSPQKMLFGTFDNPKSISAKTKFAIESGLGGIMFWQLAGDLYENGLLHAIDATIRNLESAEGSDSLGHEERE
jgi:chitinase